MKTSLVEGRKPFFTLFRPDIYFRNPKTYLRLLAIVRNPINRKKRKTYRRNVSIYSKQTHRSRLLLNLRAIFAHPFSPSKRKALRVTRSRNPAASLPPAATFVATPEQDLSARLFDNLRKNSKQTHRSRLLLNLRAIFAHPFSSSKRKALRVTRSRNPAASLPPAATFVATPEQDLSARLFDNLRKTYRRNVSIYSKQTHRSRLLLNLRSIFAHPFSPSKRKALRVTRSRNPAASLPPAATFVATPEQDLSARLFDNFVTNALCEYPNDEFIPISDTPPPADKCDVKLIAYYLPQYHPIPENDEWWGKGFTEWKNVTRAFPNFIGHYQPRVPGELGYYDLRLMEVMRRQVKLARSYGISAFCFHFYWFGGRRLLELPTENYLNNPDFDLPFTLCWANENWSRRWDGSEHEVLIAQNHSPEDDVAFIRYIDRYFRDPRYLKIDGKPILTVYRPSILPDALSTVQRWRAEVEKLGYPGIYLIATNSFEFNEFDTLGFDALSEFPPHQIHAPNIENILELGCDRTGIVRSYEQAVEIELQRTPTEGVVHPGVFPSWDNSARRPRNGHIFHGATPQLFQRWLDHTVERASKNPRGQRFVMINAWNEWAEGAYLEPDRRFGYANLDVCAKAIRHHVGKMDAQQRV